VAEKATAVKAEEPTEARSVASMAESVAKMVEHIDMQQTRQVPIQKARIKTPWNPEGKKAHERPKLKGVRMQNGARLVEDRMSDEEIRAANQLTPGRYGPSRAWVVVKRKDGIDLRYPNKTVEDRMEFKNHAKNFLELCTKINDEAAARKAKRKAGIFDEDDE
jgi:hypothetical protein